MPDIKSRYYKKSRIKNTFRFGLKKAAQMSVMVVVGEYMLLAFINQSLTEQAPPFSYTGFPTQIVNLAVSEKPILKVAEAYTNMKKNIDFDKILQGQYPVQVRGTRDEFRTLDLQDKEGAKVGLSLKF